MVLYLSIPPNTTIYNVSGYVRILLYSVSGYYIQCVRICQDTTYHVSGYVRILYRVCQDMSVYHKQDVSVNTKVMCYCVSTNKVLAGETRKPTH